MIVYVGNMLSRHGSSVNFMELLIPKLSASHPIQAASARKNKIGRLAEILWCVFSNRNKCKLVLIDTYSTQAFIYAKLSAILCRFLSLPYVPILHGGNLPERFSRRPRSLVSFLKGARTIVSPSLYLRDFFSARGFAVRYIPNFIELEKYRCLQRRKIQPRILWVRAFHSIYNPVLAVKSFQIVLRKYPTGKLCMVGAAKDATYHDVKRLIMETGISENVEITGILDKTEWVQRSEAYDIFINTTTVDNMPISVIEAMALGLPVVSTEVGGIPYLIQDQVTGLLTPSDDAEAMADAIFELLENPEKVAELTTRARSKVEGYSWDKLKDQWLLLINNNNQ